MEIENIFPRMVISTLNMENGTFSNVKERVPELSCLEVNDMSHDDLQEMVSVSLERFV